MLPLYVMSVQGESSVIFWGAAGCSVGVALGTWSLPFIEAAFGVHGLRFALIWDMANLLVGESLADTVHARHGARLTPPCSCQYALFASCVTFMLCV